PAKVDRGKGMNLLSNVALLEAAQLKKRKMETYKFHASGSGDGGTWRNLLVGENTEKTSGCLNGQYDFVIFCPTPFKVILS
ncbi:hypothetical protein Tco_0518764, partial [Tanacetum coccineum]